MNSEFDKDAEEAGKDAEEGAGENLPEGVLSQKHTATADKTADKNAEGQPPNGIEREDEAVGEEGACYAAGTCSVNGDLPPKVNKQA
jgi:hypothetical protein